MTSFCRSVSVVGNIAFSGETVRIVGARLAVDDAVTVDGLAVGLCHGGFQNTGSRGVVR